MKLLGKAPGPGPTRTVSSTCYMCTVNCEITVASQGPEVLFVDLPDCQRGSAMLEQRDSPRRLLHPEIRGAAHAPWRRASWDEALDHAAGTLLRIRDAHGPDAVAFAVGYTKEVRPYLQRFAYSYGSPHYITESSCCFAAGYVAAAVTLGEEYGYFLGPSRANRPETACRLVWSNNPQASQLPYEKHYLLRSDQCPVILVDPRRTSLATKAAIHLCLRPGTDGALALGLAHLILAENREDKAFLARHAHGFEAYRDYVRTFTPERTSQITGVPAEKIVDAARLYAASKPAQITISPNATTHHSNGFQSHRAILLLSALTGNLDVLGGNRPWGYRLQEKNITRHKERLPALLAKSPQMGQERFPLFTAHYPEAQGMVLADAIESGRVKAVVSFGLNLMMWPNSRRLAKLAERLDLFAVCDFFPTPTRDLATVSFPAATHLEREALIMAGSGKIQRRPAAVEPRGEARSDAWVVFQLAARMGLADDFWNGSEPASFEERLQTSDLRLADLPENGKPRGVQVPEPPERIYAVQGFGTPTGKIEFVSTELERIGRNGLPIYEEPYWSPVSRPDLAKDYPLILTSGGRSNTYTHSQGRLLESLRSREPNPRLEISLEDARALEIQDGAWVEVSSPLGAVTLQAWVTGVMPPGVVHAFHGWPEANINELIPDGDGLDPISGFPPFKSSLCRVRPAARPAWAR